MPRYFTKKIGTDELLQKIWSTLEKNDPVAAKDIKENMGSTGMSLREIIEDGCIVYWNFTPSMEKDLDKVSFDYENVGSGPESLLCDSENNDMKDIMGFKTLDNGLTFLGLQAGGDWEHPIFFIVYSDGSQLRAYIPEKGNVFNTDTKQAFGNDEEADAKNLLKRGVIDQKTADEVIEGEMSAAPYDLLQFDVKKLKEDILGRIIFKEGNLKEKRNKTNTQSLATIKKDASPKEGHNQHYLIELVNVRDYKHNFLQLVEFDDSISITARVMRIYKEAIKEEITRVKNYESQIGNLDKFIEKNITPIKQGFDFPSNNAVDLLDKMMDIAPISAIYYVDITAEQAKLFENLASNNKLKFGPFVYDVSKKRVRGAMLMHTLLQIGYGNSKRIFDKLKNMNHVFYETGDLEDFMYEYEGGV